MTIAVIKTGGKQYKVAEGQELKIEKIPGDVGGKFEFDQVLLVSDEKGEKIEFGQPTLDRKVSADILEQGRGKKIHIVQYKRKTRYRKRQGHRQMFTKVKITKI